MNFLDIRTIMFGQLLTDGVCTVVLVLLWLQNRKRSAGLFLWASDLIFQTASIMLIFLRGSIPDWLSIGLSTPLVLTGAFLGYLGLKQYIGNRSSQIHNYLLLGTFLAVHLNYSFFQPDLAVRNLNVSLGLFAICGQCAWLILRRHWRGKTNLTRGVGWVFVLFCLVSVIRILIMTAIPQPGSDFFQGGFYDTLVLLAYQLLLILLTFGLALMVNWRLLADVKFEEEKFTGAFHLAPYAIIISRFTDGLILDVNRGFEEITGYLASEAVGKTTRDLGLWLNEADQNPLYKELKTMGEIERRELEFVTKSGKQRTGLFFAEILQIEENPFVQSTFSDITEQKHAEEELQANEARYRSLIESTSSVIATIDFEGVFHFANRIAGLQLGMDSTNIVGRSMYELFPAEIAEKQMQDVRQVITKNEGLVVEAPTSVNHQTRWYLSNIQPVRDRSGQAILAMVNTQDISDYKMVEETRRKSDQRYRSLFENMLNGFAYCEMIFEGEDPKDFIYIDVNRAFETLTGLKDVVGKPVSEVIPGIRETDPGLFDIYARVARTGIPEVFEMFVEALEMWFSISVYGPEKGFFVAVFDVINARKQAEQKLKEDEARLHQALVATKGGVWEWNLLTDQNWWSEELWELYGLEQNCCKPSFEAWLQTIHPDDRMEAAEAVRKAASEATELNSEWRVQDRKGKIRWLVSRGQPIINNGKVERYIGTVLDITQRKQSEEDLRVHKEILEETGRIAKVGGWSFNAITGEGSWTDEVARIHDLDPALSISKDAGIDYYVGESRKIIAEAVKEAIDRAIPYDLELEIISAKGVRKWIRTIGHPTLENGRVVRVHGSLQDISGLKEAENARKEAENRYKALFDQSPDGILIVDPETTLPIVFNEAAHTQLGYSRDEFARLRISDFEVLETQADTQAHIREILAEGRSDFETHHRTRKGEIRDVMVTVQRLVLSGRSVLHCIFRDVTERRRAEEEILLLNATLEERVEERTAELSDLYNNAPCGYHSLDENGLIVRINDTELTWLGYSRDEVIGKKHVQDLLTPDSLVTFQQNYPEFKKRGFITDLELDLIRKDGTILSILLSGTALTNKNNHFEMSRSTMVDNTARKKAEEQTRLSQVRLESANQELEAFAYSVSHDLRAPLRGIDGWSLALLEDYQDRLDAQGKQYLDRVRSETKHMGQLIDDLLQLSRVTRVEMKTTPIDLSSMAQSIVARLQLSQPDREIEICIQPGLVCSGDERLIGIVLTNLFDNAWKFTAKKAHPQIEFGQTEKEGQPAFFVKDNGAGFDMAYAKKLFNAFQRLHKVSEFPGTGIGLATVQRIIRRHDGRVWVEAQPDLGAIFFFTLGSVV